MKNRIQLQHILEVRIGDKSITAEMLQEDVVKWGNGTFLLGVGNDHETLTDEEVLRILLYDTVPLTLIGQPETVLSAEVIRLDRADKVSAPAFRVVLIPQAGSIEDVQLNEERTVAIRYLRFSTEDSNMIFGFVEVQIYFAPKSTEIFWD